MDFWPIHKEAFAKNSKGFFMIEQKVIFTTLLINELLIEIYHS